MSEVERWITVNGQHIPIRKGESAAKAVGKFIRERRTKRLNDLEKQYDDNEKKIRDKSITPEQRTRYMVKAADISREIDNVENQTKNIKINGVRKSNEQITREAVKEWNKFSNKANKYIDSDEHWNQYLDKQEKALKKLDSTRNSVKYRKDYQGRYKNLDDNDRVYSRVTFDKNGRASYEKGNYSMRYRGDGRYQITSSHPYDLTDYSWAYSRSDDIQGTWTVKNPVSHIINGPTTYEVKNVKGLPEALRLMKKYDSKKKASIDRT